MKKSIGLHKYICTHLSICYITDAMHWSECSNVSFEVWNHLSLEVGNVMCLMIDLSINKYWNAHVGMSSF
jgi:hypothetical protein